MRQLLAVAATALVVSFFAAGDAGAQTTGAVTGFGGATVRSGPQSLFGGNVAISLSPNVEVVGEAGRISNVMPGLLGSLSAISPIGVNLSAIYGEGGVRLLTNSRAPVAGYVETTAGVARLSTTISGGGSILGLSVASLANVGLGYLNTTSPMLGAGGGVLFQFGRGVVDVGYRYARFTSTSGLENVLALGQRLSVNQVRVGVGIRF